MSSEFSKTAMAHDRQKSPSRASRFEYFMLSLFLGALSLITSTVILSELILFYPEVLSFILPNVPKPQLDLAKMDLEWYTRLHASTLAFGAWVFVWYKIIVAYLGVLVKLGRMLGFGCLTSNEDGSESCVDVESADFDRKEDKVGSTSTNSDLDVCHSPRAPRNKDIPCVYVSFLIGVIIINDCIFNRAREPQPSASSAQSSSSPQVPTDFDVILSSAVQAIHTTIYATVPAALTRLTSMATRAFPICAVEVCVLFLALYGIGYCISYHRSSSESLNSPSNLNPSLHSESDGLPRYAAIPREVSIHQ
jgi:hypothetical protein